MRFVGSIEAKVDEKGRVFLPAAFRKTLKGGDESVIYMRKDIFQPCLVLYPESIWNAQLQTLRSRLNRWNEKHQLIFRQFVSDVEQVGLDSGGRLLIPKRYLKMAGITQTVRFVGMDDTIEIWSDERADKPFMEAEEFAKAIGEIMQGAQTAASENIFDY